MPIKDPVERRAYYKAYREANREKVAECKKAWGIKNRDKVCAQQHAWYLKNKEITVARAGNWIKNNPEKAKLIRAKHRKENSDKINTRTAIRRANRKKVNDIHTSDDKWLLAEFYSLAKLREEVLGFKWHVDHIVPLSKGGRHCLTNLQVVPEHWNLSKGNRNTDIFIGATTGENDDKDSARDT